MAKQAHPRKKGPGRKHGQGVKSAKRRSRPGLPSKR